MCSELIVVFCRWLGELLFGVFVNNKQLLKMDTEHLKQVIFVLNECSYRARSLLLTPACTPSKKPLI